MNFFWHLWNFIFVILTVYTLLILARVILSWVPHLQNSPVSGFLNKVTEPYLGFFRKMGIFKIGNVDLSALVALVLLNLVTAAVQSFRDYGGVTLGYMLALILSMVWGLGAFLLGGVTLMAVIRAVSLHLGAGLNPFWSVLDRILQPVAARLMGVFTRKIQKYTLTLWVTAGVGALLWGAGEILLRVLVGLSARLPF